MLNTVNTLKGYKLHCIDGEIGKVKEFFFDDHHWTVRYLVADTGDWLTGRQVLISPYALGIVNKEEQSISVDLTKKQIEDSPSLDTDVPVSRQYEDTYYRYYGWPGYYNGPYNWGAYPTIAYKREDWRNEREDQRASNQGGEAWDSHLRSTHDVSGHHIQATDGEIGHVEDFIIDDATWAIRYFAIDTRNWWPGKKVLISPKWIESIHWEDAKVLVNLTREIIKQSPEYIEHAPITRDYETQLHQYYDRKAYWIDELAAEEHSR